MGQLRSMNCTVSCRQQQPGYFLTKMRSFRFVHVDLACEPVLLEDRRLRSEGMHHDE